MEFEALEASVEVGMERVMSGFFPSEHNREKTPEEIKAEREAAYQRRVLRDANLWAGKGLGLVNGKIPTGSAAVKHALLELLRGATRGGLIGLGLKGAMNLVFALLGGKVKLKDALKASVGSDSRQFGLFLGAFTGVFRSLNALLTSYSGVDSPKNSFLAAAAASSTLLLDDKSRRQGIALYLFSRSLDIFVKRLCRQGTVPYWKHFEPLLFGLSNVPIMYGFLFDPSILQPSYYKWILSMGNVTDKGLHGTLRVRRQEWFDNGKKIPFRLCSHGYHEGPCTFHCVSDWFLGLGRAAKIYLPVHLIPLVLFRYKSLMNDPKSTIIKTLIGYASSCAFLSTYVFCVKASQCFLRNARQVDAGWHAQLSGLLTGLSCYFEKPSRVSELTLYCIPRALEASWIYFEANGYVKSIRNFEAVLFAIAMGILISGSRADYKVTYHRSLCFVLGSNMSKKKAKKNQNQPKNVDDEDDGISKEKVA